LQIALDRARIFAQVLVRAELSRVDKDAHADVIIFGSGPADKGEMPFVQSAHRRHEAEGAGQRATGLAKIQKGNDGLHSEKYRQKGSKVEVKVQQHLPFPEELCCS